MSSTARKISPLELDSERWSIVGKYPKIMVSTLGRVRSEKVIRKLYLNKTGYLTINLGSGETQRTEYVHRLIADTFIDNPNSLAQVNHINGIKTDNRVENLEWVTASGNMAHAYGTGIRVPAAGYKSINAKLNELSVSIIKQANYAGHRVSRIARYFNVANTTIKRIVTNKTWKHVKSA